MLKGKMTTIKLIHGSKKIYNIKDEHSVNIGQISVIEYSKDNRNYMFRIKFYNSKEKQEYLVDALRCFISYLFIDLKVIKVNIVVSEDIYLQPFVDANLHLEGIISNNMIEENEYISEFLFGIDIDTYKKLNNIDNVKLIGENVELKVLSPEDAEEVLDYYIRNKKYLEPFEPLRNEDFYKLHCQRKIILENYKQFLNGSCISFGIYKNNKLIGKIQMSNIVLGVFRNALVGYSMDEKEQGKGYMKEALNLVLNYAFNEMELHRVEAATLVDNIKSKAVLKACGFKEIGISEKYLFINGKWQDHFVFYNIREK